MNLIEQPDLVLETLLEGAVHLLPFALQFPEVAGARIVLGDRELRTASYRETE